MRFFSVWLCSSVVPCIGNTLWPVVGWLHRLHVSNPEHAVQPGEQGLCYSCLFLSVRTPKINCWEDFVLKTPFDNWVSNSCARFGEHSIIIIIIIMLYIDTTFQSMFNFSWLTEHFNYITAFLRSLCLWFCDLISLLELLPFSFLSVQFHILLCLSKYSFIA